MSDPYTNYLDSLDGNGTLALVHRWINGNVDLGANPDSLPDSVGSNDAVAAFDGRLTAADVIYPNGPASVQSNGSARIDVSSNVVIGTADFTFAVQTYITTNAGNAGVIASGISTGSGQITPIYIAGGAVVAIWTDNFITWGTDIDDSSPHHLVLVGNRGGNLELYVDGVLATVTSGAGDNDISAQSATSITWPSPRFMDRTGDRLPNGSRLADVQYWTGAMTAQEVADLYASLSQAASGSAVQLSYGKLSGIIGQPLRGRL